ncbi:MAG: GntR family transcriptional regulator, partial [Chloroflexota bacterium]|nr:GntR family transcriptional regulator [Chloroflexota bacterium]
MNDGQVTAATAEHPLSAVADAYHKLTRGTLSDRTYEAVRRTILSGDLPPRTRLREVELSSIIPVSRTPIREALRRLRDEGLLNGGSRRAMEVRELDLQEALNTYQILETLEPLAAQLAARRITDETITELRQSVDLTEFFFGRGRWDDVTRESRHYHELIYEASGNPRLVSLIRQLREETHRFRRFWTRDQHLVQLSLVEDREIIEALARREADEAYRVMR